MAFDFDDKSGISEADAVGNYWLQAQARQRELEAAAAAAAKPKPKPTPTNPSGGGGYGYGGGGGHKVKGLEFYRVGTFKPGNLMAQARKEMNARLLEQRRGSNVARGQAQLANRNQMRELGNVRVQGLSQATAQQGQEYGRLNNVSLNRGMGYGEGSGANYTNLANQYSERKAGVEGQYGQSSAAAYDQLNQTLAGYDEADRAFSASLPSLTQELYRSMYNDAYQRWMAQQQLALSAVQQRNSARAAMA